MYDPPSYLWAIIIVGVAAIAASTCVVLYAGGERAGLGRRRAGLWFNAFGLTDLVLALTLGGLTASAVSSGIARGG
jgi:hypothetical protein